MKVVYLALAGGSPDHDSHKNSQMQTWAAEPESDFQVIWIHGDPLLTDPQLKGRDLFLPIAENYENLLGKTLLAVRWVQQNLEFDFLIRTNTSNYFYHPLVLKHLEKYTSNQRVVGGVIAEWKGTIRAKRKKHTYVSGAGIFLSAASVELLSRMNSEEFSGVPDDVAIGSFLDKCKVNFFSIPRNNITDYKIVWPTPQTRVKSWKNSDLTIKRMHEIHRLYQIYTKDLLAEFSSGEIERCKIEKPRRNIIFNLQIRILKKVQNYVFRKALNLK